MKPPAKPSRPAPSQERILVQIEKPVYGGAFLARVEGKAVFAPLTLPGEEALVRIEEEKRSYSTAEAEEILKPSPERVAPCCRHFGPCGGCNYQHANYGEQLRLKEAILRETLERAGVPAPQEISILAAEPWGYRNRIRLAFDAVGRVGYRGRRSHAVIPIEECPIAAPLLVKAALTAARLVPRLAPAMKPTELSLFCDAGETALLAGISMRAGGKRGFEEFARALNTEIPALKGMELTSESQAGSQPRRLAQWGETSLVYSAAGFGYRVDQGGFFQVNRWLVDALVERVTSGSRGVLAWDLFAGVGLFARRLTESFDRVVAVESAQTAIQALEENLKGTTFTALKASTLDFLRRNRAKERPDLIVVDPPRTGLGAETTDILAEIAAPALVYVSCDPATLARDLRALISLAGSGYAIESLTLADLFPQTFHLETVVHLRRR
jgi:23S rRNA (uracil1939-C5)-methyltransferase